MIKLDGFLPGQICFFELMDTFSVLGDILSLKLEEKSLYTLLISLGNLRDAGYFMSFLDKSSYQNQTLTLKLQEKCNYKWNFIMEPCVNIQNNIKNRFSPLQKSKNKLYINRKNPQNAIENNNKGVHTPNFPGKIYKPFWQNKEINDSKLYYKTKSLLIGSINEYHPSNASTIETEDLIQFPKNFQIQTQTLIDNATQIKPLQSNQNENPKAPTEEEEKRRNLKEKLLNMFKNISQNKFI